MEAVGASPDFDVRPQPTVATPTPKPRINHHLLRYVAIPGSFANGVVGLFQRAADRSQPVRGGQRRLIPLPKSLKILRTSNDLNSGAAPLLIAYLLIGTFVCLFPLMLYSLFLA